MFDVCVNVAGGNGGAGFIDFRNGLLTGDVFVSDVILGILVGPEFDVGSEAFVWQYFARLFLILGVFAQIFAVIDARLSEFIFCANGLERGFDEALGVWSWNERVACDFEFQGPEFFFSEDVSDGFVLSSSSDDVFFEAGEFVLSEDLIAADEELNAFDAECIGEEDIGIELWRIDVIFFEEIAGPSTDGVDCPGICHALFLRGAQADSDVDLFFDDGVSSFFEDADEFSDECLARGGFDLDLDPVTGFGIFSCEDGFFVRSLRRGLRHVFRRASSRVP